jgi:hypothetical protein
VFNGFGHVVGLLFESPHSAPVDRRIYRNVAVATRRVVVWRAATTFIFGVEETPETKGWPQMFTIAAAGEMAENIGTAGRPHLRPLIAFRAAFYGLLWRRADALFELTDAVLCAQGPVRSPVELSMEPEFRRGHGSVYDALDEGESIPAGYGACCWESRRRPGRPSR